MINNFLAESVFFGSILSFIAYAFGMLLKKKFKLAIFNPLLIGALSVIAFLKIFNISYQSFADGAHFINFLLTPTTVCLALPLYEQLSLLKKHPKAVIFGILSGVVASLLGIFVLSRIFGISYIEYISLLPKSITTAIGMGVSEELGGIVSITVSSIVTTGILGNMIADVVFKIFKIEEPISRGLALGTASHAIGTARAMEMGRIEGAMGSLSIVVAGLMTVVLAPMATSLW